MYKTVIELDVSADTERMSAVRGAAAEVVKRYDRAYWLRCIEEDRPPYELMEALAESGLLGIGLGEEFGGNGGGIAEEVVLSETLGRAGLPVPYLTIAGFTRRVLARYGTAEQRQGFIPRTLSGKEFTSFAITEANSGTNAFAIRTTAVPEGDGWRVNGEKIFISGVEHAAQMLLVARTGATSSGKARLSLFILDLPAKGVEWTRMRTSATLPEHQYTVSFQDVYLPAEALVGEEGSGAKSMFVGLNPERILSAATTTGIGFHLLERAAEHARAHAPFGRPIGEYQGVQHPLARAYVQLLAARLAMYDAAFCYDSGDNSGLKANSANFLASEAGLAAYDSAFQAYGGAAFDRDTDVLPFYEFMRLQRSGPINNESILNFVAEQALGLPRSS